MSLFRKAAGAWRTLTDRDRLERELDDEPAECRDCDAERYCINQTLRRGHPVPPGQRAKSRVTREHEDERREGGEAHPRRDLQKPYCKRREGEQHGCMQVEPTPHLAARCRSTTWW